LIAEKLGMTRDELKMRMSSVEFQEWKIFLEWRHEKEEEQMEKIRNR